MKFDFSEAELLRRYAEVLWTFDSLIDLNLLQKTNAHERSLVGGMQQLPSVVGFKPGQTSFDIYLSVSRAGPTADCDAMCHCGLQFTMKIL